MTLTIVGLGPGDGRSVTREAWDVVTAADTLYVRTMRHPAVDDLPDDVQVVSFDQIYELAEDFASVYEQIVQTLLAAEQASGGDGRIVYAVPGHPLMGEATVTVLLDAAATVGLETRIIAGMSFVEPSLIALGLDGLDGLQLFDAIDVAARDFPPLNTDVPALLAQVYNRLVAAELKLTLMALYPDEHEVVLVHGAGTIDQELERVPLYEIDRSQLLAHLTSLFVPPLPSRSSLSGLADTVAHLRGPEGCPWDQEQSPQSMRAGFLEEVAEVLDALDGGEVEELREELGDLLYHLVMQVVMAQETESFTLSDVIAGIDVKLRRRHPHVWGDWQVADSDEVVRNWEMLKADERDEPRSIVDKIPQALPALAQAHTLQSAVVKVGFDWPSVAGVEAKVEEELAELHGSVTQPEREQEVGDLLFAVVNWARWLNVDAEIALREANRRFQKRFRRVELLASAQQQALDDMSLADLDALWERAKRELE